MRARKFLAASGATAALVLGAASPVFAGTMPILELDPNPAYVGDTVTVDPLAGCPNYELEKPTVEVVITGPENSSFEVTPEDLEPEGFYYDWTAQFTAGPAGVYTVNATCFYEAPLTDTAPQARQQLPTFEYSPATLQVIAPEEETTTTTTAAPTTTTAATPTTTPAPPATAVAASPRYTG